MAGDKVEEIFSSPAYDNVMYYSSINSMTTLGDGAHGILGVDQKSVAGRAPRTRVDLSSIIDQAADSVIGTCHVPNTMMRTHRRSRTDISRSSQSRQRWETSASCPAKVSSSEATNPFMVLYRWKRDLGKSVGWIKMHSASPRRSTWCLDIKWAQRSGPLSRRSSSMECNAMTADGSTFWTYWRTRTFGDPKKKG